MVVIVLVLSKIVFVNLCNVANIVVGAIFASRPSVALVIFFGLNNIS